MSRTVHHVTYKNRLSTRTVKAWEVAAGRRLWRWHLFGPILEWHIIRDLRYSAASLAKARGERPKPARVVKRLEAFDYPRTYCKGHVVQYRANRQERALRAADRAAADRARHLLRAAGNAVDAAWDVEFPDPRHRHFAVWDSW